MQPDYQNVSSGSYIVPRRVPLFGLEFFNRDAAPACWRAGSALLSFCRVAPRGLPLMKKNCLTTRLALIRQSWPPRRVSIVPP